VNLPEIAVNRPITVLMITLAVVLLGGFCFYQLAIDLLPDITFPVITVITSYEGVSPQEIERLLSEPIEGALSTVTGVKHVSSTSMKGTSAVMVEFDWGTDLDEASAEARDRLNMISAFLPDDADDPVILKFDISAMPVMLLKVHSTSGRDPYETLEIVEDIVKPRLEQIDGVAMAMIMGGREREFNVRVDLGAMKAYNLDFNTLAAIIRYENVNISGGSVIHGFTEYSVRSVGELPTAEEIGEIVIGNMDGTLIRVKDVAEVEDGYKEKKGFSLTKHQESIAVMVRKQSGANTVKVVDLVLKQLPQIQEALPEDIKVEKAFDMSRMIRISIRNMLWAALEGGLLAVFIIFIFLRNLRPTIVAGIAIPTSILVAVIFMYFQNMTINVLTLGGLTIALGRLVDDSVVVVENTFRHIQMGEAPIKSAVAGASEVAMAITVSTFVTVIVFLPLVFVTGIAGVMLEEFALTVTYSLMASLFVALIVVPAFASRFFSERMAEKKEWQAYNRLREWYGRVIAWCLNNRWKVLITCMALFFGSLALLLIVEKEFIPKFEESDFMVAIELPKGTPLEETEEVVGPVYDYLTSVEGIESEFVLFGEISEGGMGQMVGLTPGPNTAFLLVVMKDRGDRDISYDELTSNIREMVKDIPGANMEINTLSTMIMGGRKPLTIEITGYEIDKLSDYATQVETVLEDTAGVTDISNTMTKGKPEIEITYNRQKLSQMGLTVGQVANTIKIALEGAVVSRIRIKGKEVDIRIRLAEEDRKSIDDVGEIPLMSPMGFTVPLREVADIAYTISPAEIHHKDQRRLAELSANIEGRTLETVVVDVKEEVDDISFEQGYLVNFAGEYEDMIESFKSLGLMLVMAIILIYMIMAAQFESLLHPLSIMFSMPFAATGAFLALFITNQTLCITSFIGLILLMGIVVTNAVVLVDYVNQLRRKKGLGRMEALVEGGKVRLRPILMTALATIFAMIPGALALREGQDMEQGMGIVVIGGLITSTILTLVIVPIVYSLLDEWAERVKGRIGRGNKV